MKAYDHGHFERVARWLVPLLVVAIAGVLIFLYFSPPAAASTVLSKDPLTLSIANANVSSSTVITVYLRNVGTESETVNTALVDSTVVDMFNSTGNEVNSITLPPGSGTQVTLCQIAVNWADGASHTVEFVTYNGTSARCSVSAASTTNP